MGFVFTWLRLSAIRQLDWYRNSNYQSKDIAHVQKVITQRAAEKASGADDPLVRLLARLTVSLLPRGGGDGDAIRMGILHIMRDNGIKEGHRPVCAPVGVMLVAIHVCLFGGVLPCMCVCLGVFCRICGCVLFGCVLFGHFRNQLLGVIVHAPSGFRQSEKTSKRKLKLGMISGSGGAVFGAVASKASHQHVT